MENHQDLPQLESVQAYGISSQIDGSVYSNRFYGYGAVTLIFLDQLLRAFREAGLLRYWHHRIGFGLCLFILFDHCFVRVYKWRTDKRGLTARKILWRNSIRWSDVREVKARISSITGYPDGYRLIADNGSVWVPVPLVMQRPYALLIGSIYQNLNRYGKAGEIKFPDELTDLYWSVPDSIPQEAGWKNHCQPGWRPLQVLLIVKALAWALLCWASVRYIGWHVVAPAVVVTTLLVGALLGYLWLRLYKERTVAVSARVDEDGIKAETGFGKKTIHWHDIRYAEWRTTESALKISGRKGTVRLPNDKNSAVLLLAVLRKLREMDQFKCIAIPNDLRNFARAKAEVKPCAVDEDRY